MFAIRIGCVCQYAGTVSLHMSRVLLRILLARVPAQNRTSHCGNRSVRLSSLGSQCPPGFCRKFGDVIASQTRGYQSVSVIIARRAESGQCDDTVVAGLRGLQLDLVLLLLLRLKAACPTELPLLSPLRLNDYELALNNHANTTDSVEHFTALRSPRRHQYRSIQAASGFARHAKERTVARRNLRATL